jgi:hypothetical protein
VLEHAADPSMLCAIDSLAAHSVDFWHPLRPYHRGERGMFYTQMTV